MSDRPLKVTEFRSSAFCCLLLRNVKEPPPLFFPHLCLFTPPPTPLPLPCFSRSPTNSPPPYPLPPVLSHALAPSHARLCSPLTDTRFPSCVSLSLAVLVALMEQSPRSCVTCFSPLPSPPSFTYFTSCVLSSPGSSTFNQTTNSKGRMCPLAGCLRPSSLL